MTATAYCLLDAGGRVLASREPDRSFYAASTIKLGVMAAVARLVDAGRLAWDSPVEVRSSFASGVPGAGWFELSADDRDLRMPPDGSLLSVRALTEAMIARSSNEATNLLVGVIGLPEVAVALEAAGASGCRMQRLIGDTAAQASALTNEVTPRGLATLMRAIVTGGVASAESTAVMVGALRAQEFPVIAEVVPAGTVWGSKSGWVPGIEHDVAFIGEPGSPELRVLAVCTEGFADRSGRSAIGEVARSSLAHS